MRLWSLTVQPIDPVGTLDKRDQSNPEIVPSPLRPSRTQPSTSPPSLIGPAWLAELGASSPLVEDLFRTVRASNWTAAHAIAECLSVDVTVAA